MNNKKQKIKGNYYIYLPSNIIDEINNLSATNWFYTGKSKRRTDKYVEGNKHSRHYDKGALESIRKVRSAKHRYICFCCNKRLKKAYLSSLNYEIFPYPKEESRKYVLGNYIKQELIYLDK